MVASEPFAMQIKRASSPGVLHSREIKEMQKIGVGRVKNDIFSGHGAQIVKG